jgi:hypothetical protein
MPSAKLFKSCCTASGDELPGIGGGLYTATPSADEAKKLLHGKSIELSILLGWPLLS